jgi:hypothetical protein
MFLMHLVIVAALNVGSTPQHPESLIRMAQENGGQAIQSIDVSIPIHTVPQLIRVSDLIVHGSVESVEMRLTSDERFVVTAYKVAVDRAFKGPATSRSPGALMNRQVEVLVLGGHVTVGGLEVSTVVDEYPALEGFDPGEQVVMFLSKHETETDAFNLVAGGYAAFRLTNGEARAMTKAAARSRKDRPETAAAFLTRVSALIQQEDRRR